MTISKYAKSVLFAILSVTLFYLLVIPVYTSDDDIFYLFTLSGSFGDEPSNLLSVLYGWHPMYGWLVKTLFIFFPRVNWYTVFLLFFHIAGLSAIFFFLANRFVLTTAVIFYLLLFGLFETKFLINPDFTSAALIMAIGGSLLMCMKEKKEANLGMLFLLASLLLRFHISALIILLFMPLLFSTSANTVKNIFRLAIVGVLWLLFIWIQLGFYKKNIPGWIDKYTFRESFFYLANHPITIAGHQSQDDQVTYNLIQTGFMYDETKINSSLLTRFARLGCSPRNLFGKEMRSGFYWFFINDRIYLALLFSVALLLFFTNPMAFFKSLACMLLPIFILLILTVFYKMTLAISFALFLSIYFYLIDGFELSVLQGKKILKRIAPIFLLGFLLWSGKLITEDNRRNVQKLQSFHCVVDLLQGNNKNMFVAANYSVSLVGAPVLASPTNYSVDNLLYYQRVLVNDCKTILQDHGIVDSFPAWLENKKLNLIGTPPALLSQYCWQTYGKRVSFQQDSAIACQSVYKIVSVH